MVTGRDEPGRIPDRRNVMYRHPSMTAALAEQHRRDLIARAESHRLARTARTSRAAPARPAPRFPVITQLSAMVARATAAS